MPHYDTYSPEIGLYGETGAVPVINPSAEEAGKTGRAPAEKRTGSGKGKTDAKSKGRKKATAKQQEPTFMDKVSAFLNNPTLRVMSGLFLMLLGTYLLICFISYVGNCFEDQAIITGTKAGTVHVDNYGGEGGARLSQILIDDGFGFGSLVIIFWLFMVSLKLLTNSRLGRFKTLNFTIKCLIALITVSLIIGLLTIGLDVPFNLGGAHGRYVNQAIIDFIGWAGAALLCIFMLVLFVTICLRDVVKWCIRKKRQRDAVRAARRAEMEAEQARLREMEEMQAREVAEETGAGEHVSEDAPATEESQPDNVAFADNSGKSPDELEAEADMTYIYDDGEEEPEPGPETRTGQEPSDHDNASAAAGGFTPSSSADQTSPADAPEAKEGTMTMRVNVNHVATVSDKESTLPKKADNYHFPPVALLKEAPERPALDRNEQIENKEKIRQTLLDFGIPITDIEATVGPTVTLYEIVPERGVKVSSIRNLADDIARSLRATGVRIIAPMPGRGTVGIEVANRERQMVTMRTVICSRRFQETKAELPLALGCTINNDVYIADLAKMPHLLVAGATGQGKSVGLNAIITSLLFCKKPSELKFVLIDPKMVELSLYSEIEKHYLARLPGEDQEVVITDVANKSLPVLSSLCVEMEERYQLLKNARVRAVKEYNQKFNEGRLNPEEGHRFMPYIVVIIDEFADLIMNVGKEVEKSIARLAQKARAIGIHLILTTQRPSTDVVTGLIKANFPARIAFKVSSGVDSKTILNTTEAERLIGMGDMLIFDRSELVRVQCAYTSEKEVDDICTFISQQPCDEPPYVLPEPLVNGDGGDDIDGGGIDDQRIDPMLPEIARAIINMSQASTSGVQRRYNIGYNRAGRIMDQLERMGVVGPAHGGKPRAVLVDPMALESILDSLGLK